MVQAEENPRLPKLWFFSGQFLSLNAKVNLQCSSPPKEYTPVAYKYINLWHSTGFL